MVYTFAESAGAHRVRRRSKDETVPLRDLPSTAQRATWRQSVTKPMRLNLDFDVVVDGDRHERPFARRTATALGGHRDPASARDS